VPQFADEPWKGELRADVVFGPGARRSWAGRVARGPGRKPVAAIARRSVTIALRTVLAIGALAATLATVQVAEPATAPNWHPQLLGPQRALVRKQGPWEWRRVRVVNRTPGAPRYVRQHYRTIKYVTVTQP